MTSQDQCVRVKHAGPGSHRTSLWTSCVMAALLWADVAAAMQVTSSGPQTLQKAQGEPVRLDCRYSPGPADAGALDIEWSTVSPDTTQKNRLIISYSGGKQYLHGNPALTDGLEFAAPDPSQGDASLSIASLTAEHAGTYQCKVKKPPGVDMHKLSLVVMVRPSVPKCWVEGGGQDVGAAVSLRCQAAQGSLPLQYSWTRQSGGPFPAEATQNPLTGEVLIRNHSLSFAGLYSCEVSNPVGRERCRLNLQAITPPSRAGVITGTVVGCLLLIIIILLVIWLLIYKVDWPHYEKEESNEIREDAPAPESRPTSRVSSHHLRGAYSQVGTTIEDLHLSSSSIGHATGNHGNHFAHVV